MNILFNWIKQRSTFALFVIPTLIAVLLSYMIIYLGKILYAEGLPNLILQLSGMLVFFLFGCSGLVLVCRKEWPTMTWLSLKGKPAIIFGLIWIIFWWGLGILGLIKAIQIVLKQSI